MNFKLDDDSIDKIIDIFDCIEKRTKTDLDNYFYEDKRGEEYLKTILSNETCFRIDKDKEINTIPNENIKYNCRVSSQIQSVYYSMKNKDILSDDNNDIRYYSHILLEKCRYKVFSNNKLIHPDLSFIDSEPDDNDESEEEEIDKNTVFDEQKTIL